MKFAKINGFTYAYKIHQKKTGLPYLLMLHGFMGDHRAFEHLIDGLGDLCNPVTVDLLGHGQSSKSPAPRDYHEGQQVANLTAFIHQLDIHAGDKLYLHGYSMGGRLALKTALAEPALVRGLILESTNCGIPDEQIRRSRRQTDEKRANEITDDYDGFLNEWQHLPLFVSPGADNRMQLNGKYNMMQREQTPEAIAASLRGFGTGNMSPCCDELPSLKRPVLLIAGTHDEKYRQLNRSLVDLFPRGRFLSIKAGHRVHVDNPLRFINEIKTFMYRRD